jgi:hypothetical protein
LRGLVDPATLHAIEWISPRRTPVSWGRPGYTLGMGAAKAVRPLSLEEYLALEREAPVKHELLEGFPHAMAGTGDRHNRVVVNLVLALGPLAREKGRVEVRSRSGRSFTLA